MTKPFDDDKWVTDTAHTLTEEEAGTTWEEAQEALKQLAAEYNDGAAEDFPERESAKIEYRALWTGFLMGDSEPFVAGSPHRAPTTATMLRMDELQPLICRGPGPLWDAFMASLPGYVEWWGGPASEFEEMHAELEARLLSIFDKEEESDE